MAEELKKKMTLVGSHTALAALGAVAMWFKPAIVEWIGAKDEPGYYEQQLGRATEARLVTLESTVPVLGAELRSIRQEITKINGTLEEILNGQRAAARPQSAGALLPFTDTVEYKPGVNSKFN